MLTALLLLALLQAPDTTTPPPAAKLVYSAEGRGVQIYRCTLQASTYTWVFQSPEATLIDPITRQQVGTHGAGPVWIWKDGSAVTGKVIQKSPSPDATNIPWLLLTTTSTGTATGALTSIQFVRRSDTQGGNAPSTGCDVQHADTTLRVPYTATYTFYTTR